MGKWGEAVFLERLDRSVQTDARAERTATPAKPAWPPGGIASDASAARPGGRRRKRRLAILSLLGALALSGCGGSAEQPASVFPADLVTARPAGPLGPLAVYDVRAGARRFALPPGILAADRSAFFAARQVGDRTVVLRFDPATGSRRRVLDVAGRWELRAVSPAGDRLGLRQPGLGTTRVLVADSALGGARSVAELQGDFDVDALAADRSSLFLVERFGGDRYAIRLYDLGGRVLADGSLREKGDDEVMTGFAWGGVGTSDGTWLLTLYLSTSRETAFVHALNLREARPVCIDLPSEGSFEDLKRYAVALSPDERRLYAANPALGIVAEIDLASHRVVSTASFGATGDDAPASSAASPDGRMLAIAAGRRVWAYDRDSGHVGGPYEVAARVVGIGFSGDGGLLYAARADGRVSVLETATGAAVRA